MDLMRVKFIVILFEKST